MTHFNQLNYVVKTSPYPLANRLLVIISYKTRYIVCYNILKIIVVFCLNIPCYFKKMRYVSLFLKSSFFTDVLGISRQKYLFIAFIKALLHVDKLSSVILCKWLKFTIMFIHTYLSQSFFALTFSFSTEFTTFLKTLKT